MEPFCVPTGRQRRDRDGDTTVPEASNPLRLPLQHYQVLPPAAAWQWTGLWPWQGFSCLCYTRWPSKIALIFVDTLLTFRRPGNMGWFGQRLGGKATPADRPWRREARYYIQHKDEQVKVLVESEQTWFPLFSGRVGRGAKRESWRTAKRFQSFFRKIFDISLKGDRDVPPLCSRTFWRQWELPTAKDFAPGLLQVNRKAK